MNTSLRLLLIIPISLLFSCASTQQKQVESGDAEFYNSLGTASAKIGQYDKAMTYFNKALEISPKNAGYYNNRGMANMAKGQYDEAIADFNKALQINPMLALAYGNRGRAYYFKKEYDKSWDDVKKVQALGYQIPAEFLDDLRKASGREK